MKEIFLKFWHWHGAIGKVLTITSITIVLLALIGIPLGYTKLIKEDDVIFTDIFLNEQFTFHENYSAVVNKAESLDGYTTLDKKGNIIEHSNPVISVNISVKQNEDSTLSTHKIDANDFKLKDHTGVYLPLNKIGSMIGWDMIDVHIDSKENGFVISSADFKTTKAIKDYAYVGKTVSKDEYTTYNLYFELNKNYKVEDNIIILEIDFYNMAFGYRKATDVVLLPRPNFNE